MNTEAYSNAETPEALTPEEVEIVAALRIPSKKERLFDIKNKKEKLSAYFLSTNVPTPKQRKPFSPPWITVRIRPLSCAVQKSRPKILHVLVQSALSPVQVEHTILPALSIDKWAPLHFYLRHQDSPFTINRTISFSFSVAFSRYHLI